MENTYKRNKKYLAYCPNYYKITEFEYYEDDYISEKLIQIYHQFIFSIDLENKEQINKLRMIDKILSKYIDDYSFRHELKTGLLKVKVKKNSNILESLVNQIIDLFDNYETTFTRTIYIARWI